MTALYLLFFLGLAYILATLIGQIADSYLAGQRTVQVVMDALIKQHDGVKAVHFIDWYGNGYGELRICCLQQMTTPMAGGTVSDHVFTDTCLRDYTFQKHRVTCPACLFRICVEVER